jgi:hypothetical protein
MPYNVDLTGAWAKLRRCEALVNALRKEVWEAGSPDPYVIPLRRRYDAAGRAVVFEIDRVITISDDWTLMLGDALHNLRSAINHLAWQLALRHSRGVVPVDRSVIRAIQYPIVLDEKRWKDNANWKHMTTEDAAIVRQSQPFHPRPPGVFHPLEHLMVLNDVDKHQTIHLLNAVTEYYDIEVPIPPDRFVDCEEDAARAGSQGLHGYDFVYFGAREPHPGDPVVRIFVRPNGLTPDVDWDVRLAGHIHVGIVGDMLKALDAMYGFIADLLARFGPAPQGMAMLLDLIPRDWPHHVSNSTNDRPPDFILHQIPRHDAEQ